MRSTDQRAISKGGKEEREGLKLTVNLFDFIEEELVEEEEEARLSIIGAVEVLRREEAELRMLRSLRGDREQVE